MACVAIAARDRLAWLVPARAPAQRWQRRGQGTLPGLLLIRAVPEVMVPGLKYRDSYLGWPWPS